MWSMIHGRRGRGGSGRSDTQSSDSPLAARAPTVTLRVLPGLLASAGGRRVTPAAARDRGDHRPMDSLNLADTFITFFALFGPQKVLLSFARLSRTLDDRSVRVVAAATACTAAVIGALC